MACGHIYEVMVRHGFTVLARVKCFLNSTPLYSIQLLLLHMHVMLPAQRNTLLRRNIDLPQVDLMNFRVEYVRPLSGRCLGHEAAERATKSREGTE